MLKEALSKTNKSNIKIDTIIAPQIESSTMDYSKKTREELIAICKEKSVKGYSGKKKDVIIKLLSETPDIQPPVIAPPIKNEICMPLSVMPSSDKLVSEKLNMIDLFAGTGAFTLAFQDTKCVNVVFANDMVEHSKIIYDENFNHTLTLKNLNEVNVEDVPSHDILTGGFPCFVAGTRVMTQDGYKPIETVELTDRLLTHTGKFQRIINKQKKAGCVKVNSLEIQYHPHSIECTEEHPFYVCQRIRSWSKSTKQYEYSYTDPTWITASQLTKEHFTGIPIDNQSIIPTRTIESRINSTTTQEKSVILDNLDQWFMMGYFLGDGWIQDDRKSSGGLKHIIRFAINNKDEETVIRRITPILPITDKICNTGLSKKFGCSNELWYSILKDFGKYAHGKRIPEWVQTAPKEYIAEFLLGYQTADGCINHSSRGLENHHIQYVTVSDNIAYGIQRLYLKIGKLCSVTYHPMPPTCIIEGRTVNQRNIYKMRVLIERQRSSASFIDSLYGWFKIQSNTIIATEPQTVYNFEVENDNSYCIENTIAHNCQPFSIAGLQEGFNDERSNVFWKILSIIDHHQPKCVILENVKNLVSHDSKKTFETIKSNLEKRGYHICHKVLNTAEITGIPQHRERIYIVCIKSKKVFDRFSLDFPRIEKKKISEFLETDVPSKYYYTDKSSTWDLVSSEVVKKDTIYQYRRVYVRENKSSECPTLTANMGGGGHNVPLILDNKGIRKLTPRECFNLQGFPSSYKLPVLSDSNLYKLAGNAVSVPVVKLIANRIIPLLQLE